MESQRSFFIIGLVLVSFLLYQQWIIDTSPAPQPQPAAEVTTDSGVIPQATSTSSSDELPSSDSAFKPAATVSANLITVNTDTLNVKINPVGGDVVSATLLQHDAEHLSEEKFVLLNQQPFTYVAQSGLIGQNGPDSASTGRPTYQVSQSEWTLTGNALTVPLQFKTADGIEVTKSFIFERNKHSIKVAYQVNNTTSQNIQVQPFYQLKQDIAGEESSMMMPTYRGAAYSTAEEVYEKYDFEDMADASLNKNTLGGWVGMIQHYFVSAWVPANNEQNNIYTRVLGNNQAAIIGMKSPVATVAAGQTYTTEATLFAGPKNQDELANIHPSLDLTVDYGFLWFISQILFSALVAIYGVVGNWGIAIIIITILVKTLMYPLTKKQYESMAKMRNLQPKMEQLKQRYGDDRQKFGQATMELYRKEKVNPMGGCLPLLLQMPIFLALYWVFLESVELRHAPFGLWISDLSAKDPYFILPVLFGASMFLMQKLSPTPSADPMQQKMMLWMPVIFSVFFLWFPSGLVLYWLVSNLISIVQMLVIYKAIDKKANNKKS